MTAMSGRRPSNSSGAKLGAELLVNAVTQGRQEASEVTAISSDKFVVAWWDGGTLKAQMLTASGTRIGGEIAVTSGTITEPQITGLASGGFVVSWADNLSSGGFVGVGNFRAQIFDDNGQMVGDTIPISGGVARVLSMDIAALPWGGFVATWADYDAPPSNDSGIRAQVFDGTGAPLGEQIFVNEITANDQWYPRVTVLESGDFAISWSDQSGVGGDPSGMGVKARIYSSPVPGVTTGTPGDDVLAGTPGPDEMRGFGGNDSYFVDHAGDVVVEAANEGYDIVYSSVSYALAAGSAVEVLATIDNTATTALNLFGNELGNYIVGNAGTNTLDGGAGADQLWGRGGDDSYFVDSNDAVVEYAGDGYDIVYARNSYALGVGMAVEVLATVDNTATTAINLSGNALDNYVVGNAGANTLDGGGGADTLWGREGDDSYFADMDDVVIEYAGQGNDILYAGASFALVAGLSIEVLATADNLATTAIDLTGNELDNYVTGNAGANLIDGGGGADQLWGRGGADSYYVDANDAVVEYAGDGDDIVYARTSYALGVGMAVEALATIDNTATTAINLSGNALDNYIVGNAGANTLDGGGGSDILWGREGDDSYLANSNDVVIENAGQGSDILYARSDYTLVAGLSIEVLATADNNATTALRLTGNELDNYVIGNAGANRLDGGGGSDILWGREGDDSYFVGFGRHRRRICGPGRGQRLRPLQLCAGGRIRGGGAGHGRRRGDHRDRPHRQRARPAHLRQCGRKRPERRPRQ